MIFVTFGNVPIPFTRLAKKVNEMAGKLNEEFIVQYGHTKYEFKNVIAQQFLSGNEMSKLIDDASIIISHGGYGTISECLKKGKKVVVVPRMKGEHNHSQGELVKVLEAEGYIIGVYNINDLEAKLSDARTFEPRSFKKGNASTVINEFVHSIY